MHLMYYEDSKGNRVYTLKKEHNGKKTFSAHPTRFSPDDTFSSQRIKSKKRHGMLLTQTKDVIV